MQKNIYFRGGQIFVIKHSAKNKDDYTYKQNRKLHWCRYIRNIENLIYFSGDYLAWENQQDYLTWENQQDYLAWENQQD